MLIYNQGCDIVSKKENMSFGRFCFISFVMITVVFIYGIPRANKLCAKIQLNRYFRRVDIQQEKIQTIDYYASPVFSSGLPDRGAEVVYKNEPEYVYRYTYMMTDNFYPNIEVYKNGRPVKNSDYKNLKNITVSYDEYINMQ